MNNEVEEFLRRAAQRRAQVEAQLRAQAEARARGQGQGRPAPQPQEPPRRMTPPPPSVQQRTAPVEIIDLEPDTRLGNRVSASVAEHMRHTQEIAAHVDQLGDRVESADEDMQAHMAQVFDHQVGRLRESGKDPPAPPPPTASVAATVERKESRGSVLADLLLSPQNIRNAILLNEILNRPSDKW